MEDSNGLTNDYYESRVFHTTADISGPVAIKGGVAMGNNGANYNSVKGFSDLDVATPGQTLLVSTSPEYLFVQFDEPVRWPAGGWNAQWYQAASNDLIDGVYLEEDGVRVYEFGISYITLRNDYEVGNIHLDLQNKIGTETYTNDESIWLDLRQGYADGSPVGYTLKEGATYTLVFDVGMYDPMLNFSEPTTPPFEFSFIFSSAPPVITSAASASVAENTTGTVYTASATDANVGSTLTYALSGTDAARFTIDTSTGAVAFANAPDFEAPTDADGDNVYDISVTASDGVNTSAAQAVAISVANVSEAGESVIDLGSYGKLIAPVQVQGKWYYFWDRSGDGTASESDWTSHDVLDSLFNHDNAGMSNTTDANADGEFGTTHTYRYATLNGVHLALPTLNGEAGVSAETAAGTGYTLPWSGTEYTDAGSATNGTSGPYADFTAIWDAYNGTSTGSGTSGVPPEWPTSGGPLTATPGGNGHLVGALHSGGVWGGATDSFSSFYVALQVL
jgi:hypothetical protein